MARIPVVPEQGLDRQYHEELQRRLGNRYEYAGYRLAHRYGGRYVTRVSTIARYVVHHAVTPQGYPADGIWRYHIGTRGWNTPGYHLFINGGGYVTMLLPPGAISYGAGPRWNPTSMHICLAGHFGREEPSSKALQSLYTCLCAADDIIGYNVWRGHRELAPTACPGKNLFRHLKYMRGTRYGAAPDLGLTRPEHYP